MPCHKLVWYGIGEELKGVIDIDREGIYSTYSILMPSMLSRHRALAKPFTQPHPPLHVLLTALPNISALMLSGHLDREQA